MKLILVLSLVLGSVSALAADPVVPYVKMVTSNHTVANPITATCTIDYSSVDTISTGGVVGRSTSSKAVTWTKKVPGIASMESLLMKAAKGPIYNSKCMPPMGAPMTEYTGAYKTVKSSREKNVKLGSNPCRYINGSDEAKDLIDFIDKNCN